MFLDVSCTFFRLVCFVNCLNSIFQVFAMDDTDKANSTKDIDHNSDGNRNNYLSINFTTTVQNETTMISKLRVKRQSGGKYTEAANMPQIRVLRLILQMIRNSWSSVYVGGVHPMHHEVPKPIVELFQAKLWEYFFPTVGKADHAT